MISAADLCRLYASEGLIGVPSRHLHYLGSVFRGVDFRGARVLDVGSGTGIVSCYAAIRGAASVVALEPERDGALVEAPRRRAETLFTAARVADRIDSRAETLEDLPAGAGPFDVVVLHDTINHLDEQACIALQRDAAAASRYRALIGRISSLTRSGGQVFVSDCSSQNWFSRIHRGNPFAPTIDWRKHQAPEVWIALFRDAGFDAPILRWTPARRLYFAGRLLTGNRLVSYFTSSHFHFTMKRR